MAAFMIRCILDSGLSKEDAAVLLTDVLLHVPSDFPAHLK